MEISKERLKTIIVILISSIKLFGEYIDCFMPEKAKKLRKQFNIKKENKFVFEIIQSKIKLNEKENLFEKIKIPEGLENIRKIRIYLGDQQANAVGVSKVAKKKVEIKAAMAV